VKFTMAAIPPSAQPETPRVTSVKPAPEQAPPPVIVPTLIRFEPQTEKLPEITREQLAQVAVGMKREDVVAKLGPAASKIATENEGAYVESYQYRLGGDKVSFVRFSNGFVTEITVPE
jgi:sulfur carrier protein ThiS